MCDLALLLNFETLLTSFFKRTICHALTLLIQLFAATCSYVCMQSLCLDLWPVVLWMIFSGTFALNMALAPEARKLWFVFLPTPASAHISLTMCSYQLQALHTRVHLDLLERMFLTEDKEYFFSKANSGSFFIYRSGILSTSGCFP